MRASPVQQANYHFTYLMEINFMRSTTPTQIATSFGLSEQELFRQALVSFLHERKRQVLHLKLETLARYGCTTLAELEDKIAQGSVRNIQHGKT